MNQQNQNPNQQREQQQRPQQNQQNQNPGQKPQNPGQRPTTSPGQGQKPGHDDKSKHQQGHREE